MADIFGTSGSDNLNGGVGDDTLHGLGGNDSLNGLAGADHMIGGTGDDTYFVDNAGDIIEELAGEGTDNVASSISYVLTAGAAVEFLSTTSHGGTASINLTGNAFGQVVIGNAGSNWLDGGVGGVDVLQGLGGNDFLFVDSDDFIIEAAGGGYDNVLARTSFVLNAGQEVEVLSTSNHGGTASINLTGNEFGQVVIGNAGSNILRGGGGADVLQGLGGNDFLFVDSDDAVIEDVGGGTDNVLASASFTLNGGQAIEFLSTTNHGGTAGINLTGNDFGQVVIGNAGSNWLDGGGGADGLQGLGGDDFLLVDSDDFVLEAVGGGRDNVLARTSFVLNAGQEIEFLSTTNHGGTAAINLTGNEFGQVVVGNAGSNWLDGGGGADGLQGLGGNDFLIVDANDFVIEEVGGGYDNALARTNFALNAGQEIEIVSTTSHGGTASINLSGNEFGQAVIGNAGSNILDGGLGADVLQGLGGNDTFAFTTALGGGNVDTIMDFVVGADKILLAGSTGDPFAALAAGALRSDSFVLGSAAADANDYILYNSATGAVLYDADGNGAGSAVQFATLSTGLNLSAGDFIISGPANQAPQVTSGTTPSIAENSPASTIVYQAAATDADGDRITWSLGGADATSFSIDANGAVRLNSPANFEVKASYSFTVIASDSGTVSGSRGVTLTITDVNESGPSTPIFNETAGPNDNQGSAQAIDRNLFVVATNPNLPNASLPSGTIAGRVDSFTDGDYYSITLQAGEKIVLDVDNTSEGLDSQIFLYDSNGNLLLSNDDKGTPDPGSGIQFGHNTDSYLDFRVATSGTYYFKVASFSGSGQQSLGNYQLHVSIAPVATPAQLAQEQADKNIDALISGDMWDHLNLTYGFPTSASQYPTQFDELATFQAFNSNQIGATQQLLAMIASVSQLTFLPSGQPGQANLRYAMSDDPDVAYAYYPSNGGPNSIGGTAWFGTSVSSWLNPLKGNYAWMGILHETGHALGLKHGHEDTAISSDRDSVEYSVMTYRSYVGGDLEGYSNEQFGYPQTLMQYDIGALQRTYGANFNSNGGDSFYTWSPTTGEMSINGLGQGAPGANRIFMTLWDGGGDDTYNFSNYTTHLVIDLRPGEWTRTSDVQLANLGDSRIARGNIANALLFNDDPRSLIENAVGGFEADTIIANQASNRLTGGAGGDAFTFRSVADSSAAAPDTIMDFISGFDHISLSSIDANSNTPGDDSFSYIGNSAFHNVAGELRWETIAGSAHIFADVDGNGVADLHIILNNTPSITSQDIFF